MMGYIYVESSNITISMLLFGGTLLIYTFYSISISDNHKKRKRRFLKAGFICAIVSIMILINLNNINYIDSNHIYFNKSSYTNNNINSVRIESEDDSLSLDNTGFSRRYYLCCYLYCDNDAQEPLTVLDSDHFLSYKDLYNFLLRMNCKVEIEKDEFDDLITHERKRLRSKNMTEENVKYIKLIEDLSFREY